MNAPEESAPYLLPQVQALAVVLGERDEYTNAHCGRTCGICVQLGEACRLSSHELKVLRMAAGLHDVGKVGIPDRVLLKPGPLDPEEWAVMETHTMRGQHILSAVPLEDMDEVGVVVRHHHERFDGQGYPDGLAGEQIPVLSRIIALADSYDAISTSRPYHEPRSHDVVMRILSAESGRRYDPYLYGKFAERIGASEFRVPQN